jgi:hypothetical protein
MLWKSALSSASRRSSRLVNFGPPREAKVRALLLGFVRHRSLLSPLRRLSDLSVTALSSCRICPSPLSPAALSSPLRSLPFGEQNPLIDDEPEYLALGHTPAQR